jgi:enterochelin esterase-like enzyme
LLAAATTKILLTSDQERMSAAKQLPQGTIGRRQAFVALAALLGGCSRREEPAVTQSSSRPVSSAPPAASGSASATSKASSPPLASNAFAVPSASSFPPPQGPNRIELSTIFLDASQGGPHWIRVATPAWDAGAGFPLLIALHGLGEAQKGREPGSWGWIRDYKLDQAMIALRQGALTSAHFQGFVDDKRLARINRSLKKRPFRGVVVACPYTPDLITEKSLDNAQPFAALLRDRMLPRIRKDTGVLSNAASTGLDGVSLGARLALLVGLALKDAFGAIGSMQTAIEGEEVKELSRRVTATWHDGGPKLRLLTSDKDVYREAVLALHLALKAAEVQHEYLMVPGPHAYAFNRGPGSLEMLLWHDRVLRGEPSM